MERMDEEHVAKKVENSDVEGYSCSSSSRLGWREGYVSGAG